MLNFILVILLALLHLFAGKLPHNRIAPEYWISLGSGVSIAYVFLEILPNLQESQEEIAHTGLGMIEYLENHVYLLALLGLVLFYGLNKLARRSSPHHYSATSESTHVSTAVFWLQMSSYSVYNALFSYLLNHTTNPLGCLLLFLAVALHFGVNDRALRDHFRETYDRQGRWVLSGAIITGWVLGKATTIDPAGLALVKSLLAGGIILNVLKQELPEQSKNHFGFFTLGVGIYSGVLLLAHRINV